MERIYDQEIYDFGDLMTVDEWIDCVKSGGFTRYDGWGYYCKDGKMSNVVCWDNPREDATHIIWLNR